MAESSGTRHHPKGELNLLRMADTARRMAGSADAKVADLFMHHAALCERAALRPVTAIDHTVFDHQGHPRHQNPRPLE